MAVFSVKNLSHYALAIGLVLVASYFGKRIKATFDTTHDDEAELIRKYLLNDSPLYGYNRPKLWIHTKYEYNARKWQSFMSRSSLDLNQPYLHLTIKTIINHCGNDFNVCLIDDNSFRQLIPGWTLDLTKMSDPIRAYWRELAMTELLYIYGGMVVPNSFVCMRNLLPLYNEGIRGDRPFVMEAVDHYATTPKRMFSSDPSFMGAIKRSPEIRQLADYLKVRNSNPHFSSESEFLGYTANWCNVEVTGKRMNMMDGICVGVKTRNGRPIILDDLMEEKALNICPERTYGIMIPSAELLKRIKHQWFAVMSSEELLGTNMCITKYLITALTNIPDATNNTEIPENMSREIRTVVSI